MELDPICSLCKHHDINCTTLSYRSEQNSVEENLIEMYGDAILHYINSNQPICLHCVQIINNMIRVKRQAYEVIIDNVNSYDVYGQPSSKVFNFAKIWHARPSNLDNDENSVSPNDLLVVSGSIPYNERCDPLDPENNYSCDTPFLDKEVERVTSGKLRKKRSHNWTRRKSSSNCTNKSRSTSPLSHVTADSRTSTVSRVSATITEDKKRKNQLKRILGDFFCESKSMNRFTRQYLKKMTSCPDDEDENNSDSPEVFARPSVSTRYASSIRQEVLSTYQELIFECPSSVCEEVLYSLEQFTQHQVKMHNRMAMYWCQQCNFYYLTKEHLEKHQSIHYRRFMSYCIFCAEKYTDKKLYEEHLDEHLNKSFSCAHCDKFNFVTKKLCEIHIKTDHPGEKLEVNPKKRPLILDRIDKNVVVQQKKKTHDHFEVRILVQNPRGIHDDDTDDDDDIDIELTSSDE